MLSSCDIIMLAIFRWDGPYSSTPLALAKEFAKNNRVFFLDNPITYKEYWSERNTEAIASRKDALLNGGNRYRSIPDYPENFIAVTPPVVLPINWMPANGIYSRLAKTNDQKVNETIRGIIEDYKVSNYIFINGWNPFYGHTIPKDIAPDLYVYQSVDDMSQAPYVAKHGPRLEREMIAKADFVTCTSKELVRIQEKAAKKTYYLPNAADITLFKKAAEEELPRPTELQGLEGKKIIGYTGAISMRMDYDLLKKIAEQHSDKILLMIGPKGDQFQDVGLDEMSNVIFTGRKNLDELPSYLRYVDCAIIPFLCTQLTKSIYPLKINEYLAAGKPVISTNFSDDIGEFSDIATIATNHEDFIRGIQEALDNDSVEAVTARIEVSETNTWEARVKRFWRIVEEWEREQVTA